MNDQERFTAYITRYVFTEGIVKETVCLVAPDMVQVVGTTYPVYYHKGDWHRDKAEAIARAQDMRWKKLASLKKQIAKLERMTF